jgi:8-amino-7-oxononanoate synthase
LRTRLKNVAQYFRTEVNRLGFDTGNSTTQIIPLIIGSESNALALSAFLEQQGVLAAAIRTPTVPWNQARIRISLSAAHTDTHIEKLLTLLEQWKKKNAD